MTPDIRAKLKADATALSEDKRHGRSGILGEIFEATVEQVSSVVPPDAGVLTSDVINIAKEIMIDRLSTIANDLRTELCASGDRPAIQEGHVSPWAG